ncbi:MAG TPA: DUF3185 family protein [Phycisphaerales bacterium]|nr:DUF3185 family protein [Phycisphaerales bacterium]
MQIHRLIGIFVAIVGVVLLVMGIRALDSFGSQVSEFFTGSPTDRAVWLTIGGLVLMLAGAVIAMLPSRALPR